MFSAHREAMSTYRLVVAVMKFHEGIGVTEFDLRVFESHQPYNSQSRLCATQR